MTALEVLNSTITFVVLLGIGFSILLYMDFKSRSSKSSKPPKK